MYSVSVCSWKFASFGWVGGIAAPQTVDSVRQEQIVDGSLGETHDSMEFIVLASVNLGAYHVQVFGGILDDCVESPERSWSATCFGHDGKELGRCLGGVQLHPISEAAVIKAFQE